MLLGAILGLAGSLIPELLKLYKEKKDREYELQMFKLELEKAETLAKIEIEKAKTIAQIELDKAVYEYAKPDIKPTGFLLADTLQAIGSFLNTIIRPIITLLVVILWFKHRHLFPPELQMDIISCVITFWFGNRTFSRVMERVK